MDKIKLLCIPYAGGSAQIYRKWEKYISDIVDIIPVELAGRGKRFSDLYYSNIDEAIEDILSHIKPIIMNHKYALFGHSMGSALCYELSYKIHSKLPKPVHVFFSGRYPPFIKKDKPILYNSSDTDFINEIVKMGGTSSEFLNNKELLDVFLPIMRADYKIIETYDFELRDTKLDFDVSVFSGKQDCEIENGDLEQWGKCILGDIKITEFDGGHFFIQDSLPHVLNEIRTSLQKYIN